MTREEAMTTGRDLDVYIDSEMADEKTKSQRAENYEKNKKRNTRI